MKRLIARVLAATLVLGGVACSSDQPVPSGRLLRPSGLAYVPRSTTRRDLFIADSEAQGLRLLQSETVTDREDKQLLKRAFVASPAVYFPLLISTPGFPTDVAASKDGARIYALAPASAALYVIDGAELPFAPSPALGGPKMRLEVDLASVAEDGWVPVAVRVLPGDREGRDVVLIAFDVLGGDEGRLVALSVEQTGEDVTFRREATQVVPIAPGPRALVAHGDTVVVSSARSNSVSVVPTSTSAAVVLGAERRVDVGGPTAVLVDAREMGVLAVRLDAFMARVLSDGDAGLEATGSVELHASPVASGAYGRLASLAATREQSASDSSDAPDVLATLHGEDGLAPLIALVHADAQMSFIIPAGPGSAKLVLAEDRPARVSRLAALSDDAALAECMSPTLICSALPEQVPTCEPSSVVSVTSTGASALSLRATFQGALASWQRSLDAQRAMSEAAPVHLSADTSTDTVVLEIQGVDFVARQVRPGDVVELAAEAPVSCEASDGVDDLQGTATVAGVDPLRAVLEVRTSSIGSRLARLVGCSERVSWFSYEIHPASREVVVASVDGTTIESVHTRIALSLSGSSTVARLALEPNAPLQLQARMTGDFSCTAEEVAGPPCFSDAACGGSTCQTVGRCEGTCRTEDCPPGTSGCLTREVARRCTSIALDLAPPLPLQTSLARGSDFVPAAPGDVVFDPLRPGFFVSFPGAREIVDAHVLPGKTQVELDRIR